MQLGFQQLRYGAVGTYKGSLESKGDTDDSSIRRALLEYVKSRHRDSADPKLVEELGLSYEQTRIDLAVIDNHIYGYEIKSDLDSLNRLVGQSNLYNGCFDELTLVVGAKHIINALYMVPDWWGVILAKKDIKTDRVRLYDIREAARNPAIDKIDITKMLLKSEALNILIDINKADGVKSKSRSIICEHLANCLDASRLRDLVGSQIRQRRLAFAS